MRKFGIDVSKWQGNFNFSAAKREGVTFAILKGGGGDDGLYTDSSFESNYNKAKKLGLPVGAYWFSKALNEQDAIKEADYFFNNVLKGRQFELPVFIDVEHQDMISLGKDLLTKTVDAWCSYLEKKGYFVGIYASVYAFSAYMNDDNLQKYTHWVAQWAEKCTYMNKDVLGFWQFGGETNLLRSNVIAETICDQNYMYNDYPSVIKEGGFNGFDEKSDTPAFAEKKTVEALANEVIQGKWGNGSYRKEALENAGYDYPAVQSLVNKLLKTTDSANLIKVGDLVKMEDGGVIYGTNKRFAPFVYVNLLYVRELKGDRAVISLLPEGAVTGAVEVKYLTKIKK